jgi:anti-sigma-K factor RskA
MSQHDEIIGQLPAYAIGALEEEKAIQVSQHLAICASCRDELVFYQDVADHLALAAPDADPPARLKQALLSRARPFGSINENAIKPPMSWWQSLTALMRRTGPAWGAVSLVLIVALGISNLILWQRVNQQGATPQPGVMRAVTLLGTDAEPGAVGTVIISMDGEHGALVVDGLSPLEASHQYQIWLIRNGQRTSGGVFSVDEDGYGVLWLSSPQPLHRYDAVGITIEPAGGSPGPTGIKVLGGTL